MSGIGMILILASSAVGQTASAPAFPFTGEVIGENVYVRCGPGTNYYFTSQLNTADKIQVIGEQSGWLKIMPPPGSFSYVDMTLAKKEGDQAEIIADNVRIWAGSTLSNRKREVQMTLAKGTRVKVLGDKDGFYKIEPPPGAALWVNAKYVRDIAAGGAPLVRKPHPASQPAVAKAAPRKQPEKAAAIPVEEGTPLAAGPTGPTRPAPPATQPARATLAASESESTIDTADGGKMTIKTSEGPPPIPVYLQDGGKYATELAKLEETLRATFKTANLQSAQLTPLLKEYEPLAAQKDEPVVSAVAKARLGHIRDRIALLTTREQIAAEHADLDAFRRQMDQDRVELTKKAEKSLNQDVEYKGELRSSLIFAPELRRYRLVDTTKEGTTVAYVQLPPEITNIDALIGQYVMVKPKTREYSGVGVPVIIAESIRVVGPAASQPMASAGQ